MCIFLNNDHFLQKQTTLLHYNIFLFFRFGVVRQTAIAAEPVWAAPTEWKELDVEADLKKLEKEAEARLEAKSAELLAKIETTGAKSS